jgi:hypothetical protein
MYRIQLQDQPEGYRIAVCASRLATSRSLIVQWSRRELPDGEGVYRGELPVTRPR